MTPAHIEAIAERLFEYDRSLGSSLQPRWHSSNTGVQAAYRARVEAIAPLLTDDGHPGQRLLPAEMTPAIADVLGLPSFRTGPVAHVFQAAGFPIKRRFEDEQAFVLWRFLGLALRHGEDWRRHADADVRAAKEKARAAQGDGEAAAP